MSKRLKKERWHGDDNPKEQDVTKAIESMIDPFTNNHGELVHLATGSIAPPEVAEDMKTML